MRVWLIGALLMLLVAAVVRPLLFPRPASLGGNRFPWITMTILLVAVLVLGWFEWRWRQVQYEAADAVRTLTGRADAEVECQRSGAQLVFLGDESGRVEWVQGDERNTGNVAWLDHETCAELAAWLRSDRSSPTIEQVTAVHVLTHEAIHVSGHRNEAMAECVAMAFDARLAELLGATAEQAAVLAQRYAEQVYPRMPSSYRGDCAALLRSIGLTAPAGQAWPG